MHALYAATISTIGYIIDLFIQLFIHCICIYIYIYPFHDGQNVLTPLTPPNVVDVTNVETGCFCTSSVRSRGEMTNDSSKVLVVVAKDVVLVALVATMPAIQDIIRYPSEMV